MGVNGGVAMSIFVDGWLEGLWRIDDGRPTVVSVLRKLTRAEQSELDEEFDRVTDLLVPLTRQKRSDGSAPARGPRQQRGDGGDAGGRGAQHLGAQAHGVRAGVGERGHLVVGQPALGADDDDHPSGGGHGQRRERLGRLLVQHHDQVGLRHQRRPRRRRGRARRPRGTTTGATAWRPRARSIASVTRTSRPARPSRRRRTATADHGTISATPTSVSTSTASSPRSPFGIACTTMNGRLGRRVGGHRRHGHLEHPLAGRGDLTGDRRPAPVGQHDRLPHPQPAYGDGVVCLVALDGDRRPDVDPVQRRDEVDGQGHSGTSVRVERVADPAEHRLVARPHLPVGCSSPRMAASSVSSSSCIIMSYNLRFLVWIMRIAWIRR